MSDLKINDANRRPYELDGLIGPQFWQEFTAAHWEKSPALIRSPFSPTFISPPQLFDCVKEASERYRSSHTLTPIDIRIWLDNALIQTDLADYLPLKSDDSVRSYMSRLQPNLGGRGFSFMLNKIHVHFPELWERFRSFFHELYPHVGLPPGGADSDVLIGTYKSTGFGVHKDAASNFTLVVEGNKSILAWPDNSVFNKIGGNTCHFEEFREDAVELKAGPGDLIYWPSSYWHVGRSDVPSMTLQLAFYFSPALDERLAQEVLGSLLSEGSKVDEHTRLLTAYKDCSPDDLLPPPLIRQAPAMLYRRLKCSAKVSALRDRMMKIWLRQLTGSNFIHVPPPGDPVAFDVNMRVRARYPPSIRHSMLSTGRLLVSANGLSKEMKYHPEIVRLINQLNSGSTYTLSALIKQEVSQRKRKGTDKSKNRLLKFLRLLSSFRAIDIVHDSPAQIE
jgi:50S ribosomal protein L16 3-hydroxylase